MLQLKCNHTSFKVNNTHVRSKKCINIVLLSRSSKQMDNSLTTLSIYFELYDKRQMHLCAWKKSTYFNITIITSIIVIYEVHISI